ncbi:MAG: glycosyltransferase family 2 protein [Halioglobus sp.]
MTTMDKTPFFSIIISTRDRPELFKTALQSVVSQTFIEKEVIVVIDGSSEANLEQYQQIAKQYQDVSFLKLENRPNGHGQSYAMNYGVSYSRGQYLCFLDDDDYWTDDSYLECVFNNLNSVKDTVDVHYSNQRAVFANGTVQQDKVWLEDLIPLVPSRSEVAEQCYHVDAGFLLFSSGFAHLNCSIFERKFYNDIGAMDESIRYENDRDMYIRSVDKARTILFSTRYTSLHNIPDVKKKSNMSTVSSDIEKKLFQMRVYDKGVALCKRKEVVRLCSRAKVFELKHAATILAKQNRFESAAHYAKEALLNGFNLRWMAYTAYLIVQSWIKSNSSATKNG